MKKTYNRPQLTAHGNVEALTQATSSGHNLDGDFVSGTPLSQVTLS